jgi:hypothetical protein
MTAHAEATLMAHVNSDLVTREQLAKIEPTELPTATFRPVKHLELIETLERSVATLNMRIIHEQFAIRRDGQMLFGVMKIEHLVDKQFVTALGFRHANDHTMSIQIVAGVTVFVCDNMCFRGDSIVLRQKHSHSFSLTAQLMAGVTRWRDHANILVNEIGALRNYQLGPKDAKSFILDAFAIHQIMPLRFLQDVVKEWNEPRHEEFAPRTLWSLNNAFTEVQKQMPVSTRFAASQDLGRLCTALVKA